jgi:hypothetical protein
VRETAAGGERRAPASRERGAALHSAMPPAVAVARGARASAADDAGAPGAAASSSAGAQPTPEEAVLHANLALLGVHDADGAKGVALGRGLFRKPNPKALELVLFCAYGAIRGRANAKKVRRACAGRRGSRGGAAALDRLRAHARAARRGHGRSAAGTTAPGWPTPAPFARLAAPAALQGHLAHRRQEAAEGLLPEDP